MRKPIYMLIFRSNGSYFWKKIMICDKCVNLEFVISMPKPRSIPNFGSNGTFSNNYLWLIKWAVRKRTRVTWPMVKKWSEMHWTSPSFIQSVLVISSTTYLVDVQSSICQTNIWTNGLVDETSIYVFLLCKERNKKVVLSLFGSRHVLFRWFLCQELLKERNTCS